MNVTCLKTISSPGKLVLRETPVTSHQDYLFFPSFSNPLEVLFCSSEEDSQPATLSAHEGPIQALCVGNNPEKLLLASACKQSINIWQIYKGTTDLQCPHILIGKNLGDVTFLTFSPDDVYIAACIYEEVWVIEALTNKLAAQFSGHTGLVTRVKFCPVDSNLLVTLSEDRTYGIWNLTECCQMYRSGIVSASTSFLSLAVNPLEMFFAVGSSDGTLRVFDMTLHSSLHELNLESTATQKFVEEDEELGGFAILSLKYWNRSTPVAQDKVYAVSVALSEELYLIVGCSSCFMMLNANAMDILWLIPFTDITPNNPDCEFSVAASISFSFVEDSEDEKLVCCALSLFSNDIHMLVVEDTQPKIASDISVLSLEPLTDDSLLKADLQPKMKDPKKTANNKKKKDKMNQPLVFKEKVKSSGYTKNTPRQKLFQPNVGKSRDGKADKKHSNPVGPWGSKKSTVPHTRVEYPMDGHPPTFMDLEQQLSEDCTPINDLCFSDSGKSLACAVANQTALLMKMPKLSNVTTFLGHNGPVLTARMGHSNGILLTSGMDNTVKLWSPGQSEPVLDISTSKHNFNQDKVKPTASKGNSSFLRTFGGAQFYYVDKFIMLSHGKSLCLYKYHIGDTKNELKRYQTSNRYKIVHEFEVQDAQNITTFSAINGFHSYLALCACSNRDIVVFDLNKAQNVATINDSHKKPVHSMVQNQGSVYVSHPSEAYDLFVTAASTDGVKLWDLRVKRCVRKFEGHVNRAQKVGLAYSPCARFIAVGSEDRSVYVYDIRSSSFLHRLSGQAEVVSSVAFHPEYPLLACGTQSGKLRTYKV